MLAKPWPFPAGCGWLLEPKLDGSAASSTHTAAVLVRELRLNARPGTTN
jgi:hypothetical protein